MWLRGPMAWSLNERVNELLADLTLECIVSSQHKPVPDRSPTSRLIKMTRSDLTQCRIRTASPIPRSAPLCIAPASESTRRGC